MFLTSELNTVAQYTNISTDCKLRSSIQFLTLLIVFDLIKGEFPGKLEKPIKNHLVSNHHKKTVTHTNAF